MNIQTITQPTVEPVTAAEVKTYAHISHSEEDTTISNMIRSGRVLCEGFQNRAYVTQTLELTLDYFPRSPFCLPRSPLQSVTSITYYDVEDNAATVSTDIYQVDTSGEPGRIALKYGQVWPSVVLRDVAGVVIRYVAGYGDTASDVSEKNPNVKDAILLYCTHRLENRAGETDLPEHVKGVLRDNRIYVY